MKWIVGVVVAAALLFAGALALLRSESRTTVGQDGNRILNFGALEIPVTEDEPLAGRPPIFVGRVASPSPRFEANFSG